MLDFRCACTHKVFVVPCIPDIRNNDAFAGGNMDKLIVVQIYPDMVDIFSSKGKEHEIAFPQLSLVLPFDLISHVPGGTWQVFAVHLPIENPHKSGTIYARGLRPAKTVRTSHPFVNKGIQRLIMYIPYRDT